MPSYNFALYRFRLNGVIIEQRRVNSHILLHMSVESLPKYMFLHEDSEQMKDKRIQTVAYYDET